VSRNVEIKARITSVEALLPRVKAVADQGPFDIRQDDTYFACNTGRLKLRMFSKGEGELIYYRRADQQGPKESFYLRSPTTAPEVLRESLTLAYGRTATWRSTGRSSWQEGRAYTSTGCPGWGTSWSSR